ncbi:MAG: hypothetical protein QM763_13820 [Agriterribacter sp.]
MRVKQPSGEILFRETQYFRQTWIWVLLICGSLTALIPVIVISISDKSNSPLWAIPFVLAFQLINLSCFYFTRLETVISTEGIYYRWLPWFKKYRFLDKKNITEIQVLKYPYLQYGYHRKKGFGAVHNISGNKGFRITLNNKSMFYLGSQKINTVTNILDKNYAEVYRYSPN